MVMSRFANVERRELSQKVSLVPMSEPREILPITLASCACLEKFIFLDVTYAHEQTQKVKYTSGKWK